MRIVLNGETREVADGMSLADLLTALEKNPRLLAVERNRELVRRDDHATCVLADGDLLEIVTLVGGG